MNVLKPDRQRAVLAALLEGCSIRSVERLTGTHRDTICRLILRIGDNCHQILDEHCRGLTCSSVQCDEMWCFVNKKQRRVRPEDPREFGDTYTFTALDRESKLFITHRVGKRDEQTTNGFIQDLASRIYGQVEIFTDGWSAYTAAIPNWFGPRAQYSQIIKRYGSDQEEDGRRYSPPAVVGVTHRWIQGFPTAELVSTSHVERSNLSVRMALRRFTRLTNGFSKSLPHLQAMVTIFIAWYNLARVHCTLKTSPAVAAGLVPKVWSVNDLL